MRPPLPTSWSFAAMRSRAPCVCSRPRRKTGPPISSARIPKIRQRPAGMTRSSNPPASRSILNTSPQRRLGRSRSSAPSRADDGVGRRERRRQPSGPRLRVLVQCSCTRCRLRCAEVSCRRPSDRRPVSQGVIQRAFEYSVNDGGTVERSTLNLSTGQTTATCSTSCPSASIRSAIYTSSAVQFTDLRPHDQLV